MEFQEAMTPSSVVSPGTSSCDNIEEVMNNLQHPLMHSTPVSMLKEDACVWKLHRLLSVYMQYSKATLADKRFLLHLAHMVEPEVPKDLRTMMRYPQKWTSRSVNGGDYYHLGVARGIPNALGEPQSGPRKVGLQINIDGVPLFNNSNLQI